MLKWQDDAEAAAAVRQLSRDAAYHRAVCILLDNRRVVPSMYGVAQRDMKRARCIASARMQPFIRFKAEIQSASA
jgi:hypothetical protein